MNEPRFATCANCGSAEMVSAEETRCPGCGAHYPSDAAATATLNQLREVLRRRKAEPGATNMTPAAQALLAEVFGMSERPEKMRVRCAEGRNITLEIDDLDEEWFIELQRALLPP